MSKTAVSEPTNGAEQVIESSVPYTVSVTIVGTADILFHRWNCDAVDAKSKAAKGSKAKKSDDIESYVYRDANGDLAIPGTYLRGAICAAAKFRQDPRSPRKSAVDLFKAGVVSLTPLASLGTKSWDFEDRQRVCIQRAGVTRTRPAMKSGWKATFQILILTPEYISPQLFHDVLNDAGRLVGVGDFRPTYGRFQITKFDVGFQD